MRVRLQRELENPPRAPVGNDEALALHQVEPAFAVRHVPDDGEREIIRRENVVRAVLGRVAGKRGNHAAQCALVLHARGRDERILFCSAQQSARHVSQVAAARGLLKPLLHQVAERRRSMATIFSPRQITETLGTLREFGIRLFRWLAIPVFFVRDGREGSAARVPSLELQIEIGARAVEGESDARNALHHRFEDLPFKFRRIQPFLTTSGKTFERGQPEQIQFAPGGIRNITNRHSRDERKVYHDAGPLRM